MVEWPTNAFASDTTPVVLGVLGKDPVDKALDEIVAGRTAQNRKVQVVRFTSVEQITNCQVLYISESERRKLDSIFDALRGRPILTVSDMKGFEARGMITLVRSNASINLRINLEATRQARLQLSSRLIRLDKSLRPPEEDPPTKPFRKTD
ncbi:MAG: YfiR family protein [Verrucomicrobiota bacterium]